MNIFLKMYHHSTYGVSFHQTNDNGGVLLTLKYPVSCFCQHVVLALTTTALAVLVLRLHSLLALLLTLLNYGYKWSIFI